MRAVCQSIPVGSEGEYQHIRLSDKPEAAKKEAAYCIKDSLSNQMLSVKFERSYLLWHAARRLDLPAQILTLD